MSRGGLKPFEQLQEVTPGQLVIEALRYLGERANHSSEQGSAGRQGTGARASDSDGVSKRWLDAWQIADPFTLDFDGLQHGAFQAGMMAFALGHFELDDCAELLAESLNNAEDVVAAAEALCPLLYPQGKREFEPQERIERMAQALANQPRSAHAMSAFVGALLHLGFYEQAERVLTQTAARLPRQVVRACQQELAEVSSRELPDLVIERVHATLHPELCVYELLDAAADPQRLAEKSSMREEDDDEAIVLPDEFDDAWNDEALLDRQIDDLGWLAKVYRLDVAKLRALPLEAKKGFMMLLATLDPQSPDTVQQARDAAAYFGIAKARHLPSRKKPATAKEKNKQKRERRRRKQRK